jgi:hypothetical protein
MDLSDAYDVYDPDADGPVCRDCDATCTHATPVRCDVAWCSCECRVLPPEAARALLADIDAARAAELDDRPADKLGVIAADMQQERYGDMTRERLRTLDELRAERYWPRRGAA